MSDPETDSSFPRHLFVAFTLLMIAATAFSTHLFYRVRSTIRDSNDIHGPTLFHFIDIRSNTNNAVQECFAYIISSEEIEKDDFASWAYHIQTDADAFRAIAKLDHQVGADFEALVETQNRVHEKGQDLIVEFETLGQVSPGMFAEFERSVDDFDVGATDFQLLLEGQFNDAKTKIARTLSRTDLEITVFGITSIGLVGVVFALLVRSFGHHSRRQRNIREAIRSSEQRFRQIFDNEPHCVKLLDRDGNLIDMNSAGLDLIEAGSIEDVRGKCVYDFIAPQDRNRFVEASHDVFLGESLSLEFGVVTLKGSQRHMESREVPLRNEANEIVSLLAITKDVTRRRQAEFDLQISREKLAHASRVNMMGELASNIAHELNQPLAAATNFAFALEAIATSESPDPERVREYAANVRGQAARAADIVRGLRNLVSKGPSCRSDTDLNSIIQSSHWILEPEIRRHQIELHENLDSASPRIHCDKVQIQQILLNVVRNAVEAMENCDQEHRNLFITTLANTNSVELRVQDQGEGVSQVELQSIFDAFFTTKSEGMGMGLAISRSIAEAHYGSLFAERGQPRGTVFRLILPTTQAQGA